MPLPNRGSGVSWRSEPAERLFQHSQRVSLDFASDSKTAIFPQVNREISGRERRIQSVGYIQEQHYQHQPVKSARQAIYTEFLCDQSEYSVVDTLSESFRGSRTHEDVC
eukprot:CAMPEP_0201538256 /NCGR_PEP_ID=MMETSP0161_2-20130828/67103_1 /ASSEMBLY_ACC=CAM_ASM_000251 /TAXON_ID=180227 /ORGANISM="Neoparamoeba aestuarina, Strain SoJaBio B1-5/56/2" /LENGTH=108 /DNA_ID=CAMNT_0047944999 /DNA_START=319 /DNA_END=645 /DNA_ORIENTATION=+